MEELRRQQPRADGETSDGTKNEPAIVGEKQDPSSMPEVDETSAVKLKDKDCTSRLRSGNTASCKKAWRFANRNRENHGE